MVGIIRQGFKATIINMLKNLQEKVNIMETQDIRKEKKKKILKNQVKTMELKNTTSAEK